MQALLQQQATPLLLCVCSKGSECSRSVAVVVVVVRRACRQKGTASPASALTSLTASVVSASTCESPLT